MRSARVVAVARVVALLLASACILEYVVVACLRVRYPFELEWMEGSMVDHVRRVLDGQRLYVRPTLAFAPYIYTPLFYYVSAGVALVTGVGLLPLRIVSIAASIASFVLLYAFVRRESGSRTLGVLCAGIFAATYRLGGAWFDIGRVDSLFLALLLGALYVIRFRSSVGGAVAAGCLLHLAFLTKQIALPMCLPVLVWALVRRRQTGLALAVTTLGGIAASTVLLDRLHDGWYTFYVFTVPGGHAIERQFLFRFWTDDLWNAVWPMSLMALWYLARAASPGSDRAARRFYAAATFGSVAGAWVGRLHSGGWENVVIPAYAVLGMVFVLGLREVVGRDSAPRLARAVLAGGLVLAQFSLLAYDPRPQIPSAADRRAGHDLLRLLRATAGEVWLFDHGFLPSLAGRPPHAPSAAIWDILRAETGTAGEQLRRELEAAVADKRFALIIVDTFREFPVELWGTYWEDGTVFEATDRFWPVTGFRKRPEYLFRRYDPTPEARVAVR